MKRNCKRTHFIYPITERPSYRWSFSPNFLHYSHHWSKLELGGEVAGLYCFFKTRILFSFHMHSYGQKCQLWDVIPEAGYTLTVFHIWHCFRRLFAKNNTKHGSLSMGSSIEIATIKWYLRNYLKYWISWKKIFFMVL